MKHLHFYRTLFVEQLYRTFLQHTIGHFYGILSRDVLMGHFYRTILRETFVGYSYGKLLWDALAHSSCETSSKSCATNCKTTCESSSKITRQVSKTHQFPPKVTYQVSKTNVSYEISSKRSTSSSQYEHFDDRINRSSQKGTVFILDQKKKHDQWRERAVPDKLCVIYMYNKWDVMKGVRQTRSVGRGEL